MGSLFPVGDAAAIDALQRAVSANPGDAALSAHLIDLLLADDRADEALAAARLAVGANPGERSALEAAGRAARALGQEDLARRYEALLEGGGGGEPAREAEAPGPPDELGAEVVPLRALPGERESPEEGLERPRVRLDDVGGMEEVKATLQRSFLAPMRNPQLRQAFRKSLRGGLLLYGPPGCGKTFIARALAGELGARFSVVGIADVLDMWLGESERKLHEIFEASRRSAPCVLFLDEIDALGQKRSHMRGSAMRTVVNQLLTELDAADDSNEGVFVLAATNHPWDVDTALRRPGRFDRLQLVLPPDAPARRAILELHLRDRPGAEGLDLEDAVRRTDGYSGADLAYLCEMATELAMEESMRAGEVKPISRQDLRSASESTSSSTRAWFEVAYNYAMFANEGGQYDDLLAYIRRKRIR